HLRLAIDRPPPSHDVLNVLRGSGAPHRKQALLGLGCGHPRESPYLGVRELTARQRPGQQRQSSERSRYADAFARGARVEPHSPCQPGGARAKAIAPAFSSIELADEIEEVGGRGVEVNRKLGDLVAEAVEGKRFHGASPFSGKL